MEDLQTWKECRLVIENYEYSTGPGVTGIEEPPTPPTPLQTFIYENEPLNIESAELFRFALSNGIALGENNG